MARLPSETLTPRELQIMQVLWRSGACTVAAVQEALAPQRGTAPAYTTVQTMLNILEKKGKLKRTLVGSSYVYSAHVTEASALGQAVRDLIDRMFGGSSEELVMSLIKSREIDLDKLAELTRRVEAEDRRTGKRGGR
jgi:predicted transcriptional regulator